jgi:hypothetical protein
MTRLDGATMATQSPSKIYAYCWEDVFTAAVLEPDDALLEQRIRVAEEALLTRWLEMTIRHEHRVEIQAIVDAMTGLRDLKRERLGATRANL